MAKIVKDTNHAKGIDIGIDTTNFEHEIGAVRILSCFPINLSNTY